MRDDNKKKKRTSGTTKKTVAGKKEKEDQEKMMTMTQMMMKKRVLLDKLYPFDARLSCVKPWILPCVVRYTGISSENAVRSMI